MIMNYIIFFSKVCSMDAMLKIDLSGSLVVVDTENIDRTPRGQKTCGVLAILAFPDVFSR